MLTSIRRVLMLSTAALLLPLSGTALAATTYYVAPNADPANTTCTQAAPCDLSYAIANKGTVGDTISVASGLYNMTSSVASHAGVTIAGPVGSVAHVVNGATNQSVSLSLSLAEGASISGLQLSSIGVVFGENTSATNMDIRAIHVACDVIEPDVTIIGSICQGTEGGSAQIYPAVEVALSSGNGTVTMRNDTFFSTRRALDVNAPVAGETVNATNDVIRVADGTGASCPISLVGPNGTANYLTVNMTNDNYFPISTGAGGCGGDGFAVHLNQVTPESSDPALANAVDDLSAADFHETPSSPTRGAGATTGIPASEADLDSNHRLLGPADSLKTDIGAYELINPPVLSAPAVSGLTATGATLNATVNGEGLDSSSTFTYGTVTANDVITDAINLPASWSSQPASLPLSGLAPNTTYYWQLCTLAGKDNVCTADQTFTTLPLPPVASGGHASSITASGATLGASVNPSGAATTVHFEYGTNSSYGTRTPDQSLAAGSADQLPSATLSGLAPAATYHARVVATNAGGTVDGPDFTFTTSAAGSTTTTTTTTTTTPTQTTTTPTQTTTGTTPTPPAVTVPAAVTLKHGGSVLALPATCTATAGQSCTVTAVLYGLAHRPAKKHGHHRGQGASRMLRLGTLSGSVAAGTTGALTVKLSRAAVSTLARSHRLALKIVGIVADQSGHQQAVTLATTLKLPKVPARKHHRRR